MLYQYFCYFSLCFTSVFISFFFSRVWYLLLYLSLFDLSLSLFHILLFPFFMLLTPLFQYRLPYHYYFFIYCYRYISEFYLFYFVVYLVFKEERTPVVLREWTSYLTEYKYIFFKCSKDRTRIKGRKEAKIPHQIWRKGENLLSQNGVVLIISSPA